MSSCSNKRKSNTRNPTPKLTIPKKITLTDLSSDQKAKIGQLIILIQKYRLGNTNLQNEMKELKRVNKQINQKNIKLQNSNKEKDQRIKKLEVGVEEHQECLRRKQQEFKNKKRFCSRYVQTQIDNSSQIVNTINNVSRHDHLDIDMNTQTQQRFFQKDKPKFIKTSNQKKKNTQAKHSKAYKKIMTSLHGISRAVDHQLSNKSSYNKSQSYIGDREDQEEFSNLARLWIKIKKQNNKPEFKINPYKSIDSVLESNEDEQNLLLRYNRMKQLSSQRTSKQDQIDQFDLNLKLKKKDFRVSDLLRMDTKTQNNKKTIDFY